MDRRIAQALPSVVLVLLLTLTTWACGAPDGGERAGDATPAGPAAGAPDDLAMASLGEVEEAPSSAEEVCGNDRDDNANGSVDEGCPCPAGKVRRCFVGRRANAGKGRCALGTQTCETLGLGEFAKTTWGRCLGSGSPQPETCNGIDDDCDGVADEDGACKACSDGSRCDDGVACTRDECGSGQCRHTPDDRLCPAGQRCDGQLGCRSVILATDLNAVYEVRLPEGSVTAIGERTFPVALWDLARAPDGKIYGNQLRQPYAVDERTAALTALPAVVTADIRSSVSFGWSPSRRLYTTGCLSFDDWVCGLYLVEAGAKITLAVANPAPRRFTSFNDLAWLGGRLFTTATAAEGDLLLELDVASGSARELGATGFRDVRGLVGDGDHLVGFSQHGEILRIDPVTARTRILHQARPAFVGAAL